MLPRFSKSNFNINNWQLSESKESVLNRGLNFTTNIRCDWYLHMITPVKVQADELRWEVGESRETTKPTKSNHAKEESLAIKS